MERDKLTGLPKTILNEMFKKADAELAAGLGLYANTPDEIARLHAAIDAEARNILDSLQRDRSR